MTKTTHEQTAQSEDPLDRVSFELNDEQTKEFTEVLANPPAANDPVRELMARTPPWETDKV